jgi:spermidine synthase
MMAPQFRHHGDSLSGTGFFEAALLAGTLLPLSAAAGMALPLAMRIRGPNGVGALYSLNTLGCIAGALMAGWLLIPHAGTERTIYLAAAVNAGVATFAAANTRLRLAAISAFDMISAAFLFPRWDLAALTAGGYKYAPNYVAAAAEEPHKGEMIFFREGTAGAVTVRRVNHSLALAIDGKVDATDSGGDLLTEKLLAHLPMRLIASPRHVCVIGLASGVTAGSALTWPVERLDVVEVSPEVAEASHLFDGVNGRPLSDPRTHLILNDGRNHLALTGTRYDAIISEPSNP